MTELNIFDYRPASINFIAVTEIYVFVTFIQMLDTKMADEIISEVRVLESGKLLLKLHSGGRPDYSFIYREGVGVYWQPEMQGFISTEKQEWSYSKWFTHIVNTAASCNINLHLSSSTLWANFPEIEKNEITRNQSI